MGFELYVNTYIQTVSRHRCPIFALLLLVAIAPFYAGGSNSVKMECL
jgi:hypothetical protein